jgi:hypothetical protein
MRNEPFAKEFAILLMDEGYVEAGCERTGAVAFGQLCIMACPE